MRRHAMRPGLTLIELMVSVAILAVIILAVGYIFSQTSRAVNATQATMDVNAGIRATMAQMRRDMQGLSRKGFLILLEGDADYPPVIAFTATGRFQSQTDPDIQADEALIVYTMARDATNPAGGYSILTREAFLLTGNPDEPTLADALANGRDRLRYTLGQIEAMPWDDPANIDKIKPLFLVPLAGRRMTLNTAPATLEEIGSLRPYLQGGVAGGGDDMELEVHVVGALGSDHSLRWFDVEGFPPPNAADPAWQTGTEQRRYVAWTHEDGRYWPLALRINNLQLQDVAARAQAVPYQIVLDLPRWGVTK